MPPASTASRVGGIASECAPTSAGLSAMTGPSTTMGGSLTIGGCGMSRTVSRFTRGEAHCEGGECAPPSGCVLSRRVAGSELTAGCEKYCEECPGRLTADPERVAPWERPEPERADLSADEATTHE